MNKETRYGKSYPKTCGCGCDQRFLGRRNQKFINEAHRYRFNNNKAAILNSNTKELMVKIKLNYRILEKNYKYEGKVTECNLSTLISDGFDMHINTGTIKEKVTGETWFKLDKYAFNISDSIIKITTI